MKRVLIASLLVSFSLLLPAACKKETQNESEPKVSEWARAEAEKVAQDSIIRALTGKGAPANGSVVRVDFDNAICHFTTTTPPKAALIKDPSEHSPILKIMRPTTITKAVLDPLFGANNVACDAEACTVKKLDGVTLRIRGTDGKPIDETFDPKGADFDLFVPHLQTIANVSKINPNATKDVPATDFTVFFNFEGGTLTAKPFCAQLTLKHNNSVKSDHFVPDLVTLVGSTTAPAQLEFSKDGKTWTPVDFKKSKLVWLSLDNRPSHPDMDHFDVHKKSGNGDDHAKYPKVDKMPKCKSGVTAACGNTQWP